MRNVLWDCFLLSDSQMNVSFSVIICFNSLSGSALCQLKIIKLVWQITHDASLTHPPPPPPPTPAKKKKKKKKFYKSVLVVTSLIDTRHIVGVSLNRCVHTVTYIHTTKTVLKDIKISSKGGYVLKENGSNVGR